MIQLANIHANKHFIQAIFHIIGTNIYGHIKNVYFPQDTQHKVEILDALKKLNTERKHQLWISGGDYNMIASLEEEKGGCCRINREGSILKDFVRDNWMIDLPTNNGLFTWNNKRAAPLQIASRLDRFLISDNAVHLGGAFTASILPFPGSDHWPIALQWNNPGCNSRRPFHFETFWLTHLDFHEFVRTTWQKCNPTDGTKISIFQRKLKYLKGEIKRWNHFVFGNIFKMKDALNQEMKVV